MVTKSTLDAGEDYASVADILACEDRLHDTVTVWGWKKNGGPLKLRVRGLSLPQREEVRATAWRRDGRRDMIALTIGYFVSGFVAPSLNEEQARQIVETKHAGTVEKISDYINMLTELNHDQIEAMANELAKSNQDSGLGTEAAGAAGGDDRSLD
jgi:hypothetical protein